MALPCSSINSELNNETINASITSRFHKAIPMANMGGINVSVDGIFPTLSYYLNSIELR